MLILSQLSVRETPVLLKIEAGDLNLYYLRSVVDLGSDENGYNDESMEPRDSSSARLGSRS
jgi:hypothetical protein